MSLFEVAVFCQSNETAFHYAYLEEKGIIPLTLKITR